MGTGALLDSKQDLFSQGYSRAVRNGMGLARCSGLTSNRANVLMLFPEARGTPLLFSTASWEMGHSKDRVQGMKFMLGMQQRANVFSVDKSLLLCSSWFI